MILFHPRLIFRILNIILLIETRVFVAQLRKKIEDNPSKPELLITESGIGYRFGK